MLCHSVVSNSLQPHGLQPARLFCPWGFSRQEYWSCHALLQGSFPTQESNSGLQHCTWTLYPLSHQGSPRILECVADPFSRGSSWLGNRTRVTCIAGRFFTSWDTKEVQRLLYQRINTLPRWMLKKRRCEKLCWVFVSPKDQDLGLWERVGEDEEHNSFWSADH